MTQKTLLLGTLFAFAFFSLPRAEAASSLFGGGIHYWRTVEDIDDDSDFDEDGVAWLISYQVGSGATRLELDLEFLPEDFGGADDNVIAPQGYLLFGAGLYLGVGVGFYYADDDFADEPFYAFRGGLEMPLGGMVLDLNANYRVSDFDDLGDVDDIDSDTITLGAAIRFGL